MKSISKILICLFLLVGCTTISNVSPPTTVAPSILTDNDIYAAIMVTLRESPIPDERKKVVLGLNWLTIW